MFAGLAVSQKAETRRWSQTVLEAEQSPLLSTHLRALLQVHPGVPPLTWVPRSSSLLQVVGSHQVILRDDPNGVVELPDPPAVHVVLLGRHSGGGG